MHSDSEKLFRGSATVVEAKIEVAYNYSEQGVTPELAATMIEVAKQTHVEPTRVAMRYGLVIVAVIVLLVPVPVVALLAFIAWKSQGNPTVMIAVATAAAGVAGVAVFSLKGIGAAVLKRLEKPKE